MSEYCPVSCEECPLKCAEGYMPMPKRNTCVGEEAAGFNRDWAESGEMIDRWWEGFQNMIDRWWEEF